MNKIITKILDALIYIIQQQIWIKKDIEKIKYPICNVSNTYNSYDTYLIELENIKSELSQNKETVSENNCSYKNKVIQISSDEVFKYISMGYQVFRMHTNNYDKVNLSERTVRTVVADIQRDKDNIEYVYFILETNNETTHEE